MPCQTGAGCRSRRCCAPRLRTWPSASLTWGPASWRPSPSCPGARTSPACWLGLAPAAAFAGRSA
eukprot:15440637-Alexandrium_andersonii.AAC.1